MMKLDNQYTNVEQSEKLIELGVPEDSADCYYEMSYRPIRQLLPDDVLFSRLPQYIDDEDGDLDIVPCWSAGRLMEILAECYQIDLPFRYFTRGGMMESLVNTFSDLRAEINFSVLEQYGVGQCTRENKS